MNERLQRIVRNEALFRRVNEAIEDVSHDVEARGWPGEGGEIEFHCECGRRGCESRLSLPVDAYRRAHEQRDRFVVYPGHETDELEVVVERHDGWFVVDKLPPAERVLKGV